MSKNHLPKNKEYRFACKYGGCTLLVESVYDGEVLQSVVRQSLPAIFRMVFHYNVNLVFKIAETRRNPYSEQFNQN